MSTPNITIHDTSEETRFCTRCKKTKSISEFTRPSGNKIQTFAR
ncbi:10624_t:CDS:1, partial [Dentiscutata heterogama]